MSLCERILLRQSGLVYIFAYRQFAKGTIVLFPIAGTYGRERTVVVEHHLKTTMLESEPFGRGPAHESAVPARTIQVYGKIAHQPFRIGLQCRRAISRTEVRPKHHPSESNGCHDALQR